MQFYFSLFLLKDAIMLMVLDDETDIFDLILGAMTNFSTNEEVQIHGCRSLQLLLDYGTISLRIDSHCYGGVL